MAWLRSVVTDLPRVVFMHRNCELMTLRIGPGLSLARLCLCLRAQGVFLPTRLRVHGRGDRRTRPDLARVRSLGCTRVR